jgi:sodium-dependent dicarboxylate transporter 2/3/5
VLWLVAGGIALGVGLEESGLAQRLVGSIPFDRFSPYLIVAAAAVLAMVMANFMSNTATANLLLPIIAALGASLDGLDGIGGAVALILGTTLASSMGMALPISTPPNALAHATGQITTQQMARTGIITGLLGLLLIFGLLFLLGLAGFY